MALSANALTSLEALKRYLGITSTDHDQLLEQLIEAVSARFNAFTGRLLAARDFSCHPQDETYDPLNAVLPATPGPALVLPQYPVISLSELLVDGRYVPPASEAVGGWELEGASGIVRLKGAVFPQGALVGVVYRAGLEPVPADLEQAAIEQAAVAFQESAAGQGRLGVSARTLGESNISYHIGELLPQVRGVLVRYQRRALA